MKIFAFFLFWGITTSEAAWGMGSDKKVKLKDVDVLTLYHGKMTKGQRSSPVPQLECVNEGTAPCSAFKPKVVQCINKGSDGYDVQWECKTDMDNAYRFGDIDVSCEGYDYPDDPYILHGSCGLRYTLDYTKEGLDDKKGHSYYGNDDYSSSSHYNSYTHTNSKKTSSIIADLIVYIGMGLIVYALYKTCTNSGRHEGETAYSSTNDDYPSSGGGGGGGGYGWFGGGGQAPPPYSSNNGYYDNASCRNRNTRYGGTGAGGFWTGAATGGLLGYMFGNRQNRGGWGGGNWGWGGGWGGGNSGWGGGSSSSGRSFRSSSSSGTRTASGFGGTSRR